MHDGSHGRRLPAYDRGRVGADRRAWFGGQRGQHPTRRFRRGQPFSGSANGCAPAVSLQDLRVAPGNRLEELKGDRKGPHSIRINDQWRICFVDGDAFDVEIADNH